MTNPKSDSAVNSHVMPIPRLPLARMLTSVLPFMAIAIPSVAFAQDAVNTATITAPAGAIETNTANNTATDTDTILAVLVANDDSITGEYGISGATDVVSVLGNDTYNGATATTSDVTISVASGSSVPSELSFNNTDGTVDVVAGTPAGAYGFDYTICETANPTNCETGTVSITVTAPAIVADADSATGVDGIAGATDVVSVLDGDTLGGAAATTSNVTIAVASGSSVPSGLTFDTADGTVDVAAGTAAGAYNFDYTICDVVNPTNCDTNTVSVTVATPSIVADADTVTGVDGIAGETAVVNVLDGDTLNGVAATTSSVTLSVASGSSVPSGLTFNTADGTVDVSAGLAAGTYTFDYTICDVVNPTNCATNTVSITVTAPAIVADADSATGVDGIAGATDVVSVLDGDTLGGAAATTSNVTIAVASGSSVPSGLTFDTADGTVDVAAGTAAGAYNFDYTICDVVNPTNCATNTVSITVDAAAIIAVDDTSANINGADGGADVLNVLSDDTLNGVAATTSNVTIAVASGSSVPTGLTFSTADGSIDVTAGTAAGSYSFDYTICEVLNPTNCATATATVNVVAPAIVADADSVSGLNGATGESDVLDVLDGDTLNGVQATLGDVNISVVTPATPIGGAPVPTLDITTGLISVPANTPAGTYTIEYEICEQTNPTNCATNTATVTVAPSIDLSITKSNGVTEVTSGQTVTYTLVVSNAGPDAATGAVVSDTPGSGLSCPASGTVTITGDGVPGGSYTIGDLTSVGITLGTLSAGESTTITYDCSVN